MRLLFRKPAEAEVEPPSFGPWAFRHFAAPSEGDAEASIETLTLEALLQV